MRELSGSLVLYVLQMLNFGEYKQAITIHKASLI